MKFLCLILSVFSSVSFAEQLDKNWLKIMHYEGSGSSYHSRVTNMDFFFNFEQSKDPVKEFDKQKQFFSKAKFDKKDMETLCKFPMRVKYFSRLLKKDIPINDCKKYIKWKKLLDFKTIKFIYASSFPNNPASMFGHTLLTLSKDEKKPSLESIAISYMAQPSEEDSPPVYLFKGLTGGYKGRYQINRFYDVLKLYQKQEDRNLWFFNIEATENQKDSLLALLWEAKNTLDKPYLFFDKNCSYELLSLLYAADIIEDIRGEFGIFTMPLETYKKVAEKYGQGLEEKVFISNISNIERQIAQMQPEKKRKLYASMSTPKKAMEDTDVLDMNIQLQHRKILKNSLWMSKDFVTLSDLLVYRSNIDTVSNIDREYSVSAKNNLSPLYTNSIHRLLLANHFSSEGALMELAYRSGVRGYLDQRFLYDNESIVEFFNTSIFFDPENSKVKLNEFTLIDIKSMDSFSLLSPLPSWSIGANVRSQNEYDFTCDNCYEANVYGGGGLSLSPFKNTTTFLMVYANIKYKTENNKWLYPSLRGGGRYNFNQSTLVALRFVYSYFVDEPSNVSFDFHKNLAKNVAGTLTAKYQVQNNTKYNDVAAALKYYF